MDMDLQATATGFKHLANVPPCSHAKDAHCLSISWASLQSPGLDHADQDVVPQQEENISHHNTGDELMEGFKELSSCRGQCLDVNPFHLHFR
jgi:hypothetical protein